MSPNLALILFATVRQTTNNTGLGIFATETIYQGELLDEYFGELIPLALAETRPDDRYLFQIRNIASSTARDYGNWTRFINHSCRRFNVEAVDDVIGGRRTITFRALRRIRRNQQLLMDYGPGYFSDQPDGVLCNCDARRQPHIPPDHEERAPDNQEAVPGRPEPRRSARLRGDVPVAARDAWITENKNDLALTEPNGPLRWTMLHWRCLEQLIRWRKKNDVWRSKTAHLNLPSSRGDPLVGKYIKTLRAQMKIFQWHLDVVKAFQQDKVVGIRQGQPWETTDLLKRVFGLNVAARRRRRLSGRRSRSVSPVEGPRTPVPKGTAPELPTPPSTGGNFPTLPPDLVPPPMPGAATRARQAMRANARHRRRERRSHSP